MPLLAKQEFSGVIAVPVGFSRSRCCNLSRFAAYGCPSLRSLIVCCILRNALHTGGDASWLFALTLDLRSGIVFCISRVARCNGMGVSWIFAVSFHT